MVVVGQSIMRCDSESTIDGGGKLAVFGWQERKSEANDRVILPIGGRQELRKSSLLSSYKLSLADSGDD